MIERAGYLAHARTPAFRRRLDEARALIDATLTRTARPYVAFSAGKDSSALLWLVRAADPSVPAWILTRAESRVVHANLDAVLAWWRAQGVTLTETLDATDEAPTWVEHDASQRDIRTFAPVDAHDAVLLGLRAAESPRRRIALRRGALRTITIRGRTLLRSAPLAAWSTEDVAALHALHALPILDAYRIEGFASRTAMRLNATAVRAGAVHALRRRDRGAFNRLVARFPDLAAWT